MRNRRVMSIKTYIFLASLTVQSHSTRSSTHAGWPVARYCLSMLIKPLAWPAGCRKVDDNAKLFRGGTEGETTARDAGQHWRAPEWVALAVAAVGWGPQLRAAPRSPGRTPQPWPVPAALAGPRSSGLAPQTLAGPAAPGWPRAGGSVTEMGGEQGRRARG